MGGRAQPEQGADSPAALRSFIPPPETKTYRVQFEDYDGGRGAVIVHALGPKSADQLGREKARSLNWDVLAVLRVEEVE